ncbi:hypothetical protein [Arthrobacter sp. D1-17]
MRAVIPDYRTFSVPVLSRRQFGLLVGSGAVLLMAGGTYGAVSRSAPGAGTRQDTAFGFLAVTQAGRLARLDEQGRPAFRSVEAAAAALTGPAALAAYSGRDSRRPQAAGAEGTAADSHGHDAEIPQNPTSPQPVNLTWSEVVLVEVELHNSTPEPVLFSPGQLRLRLAPSSTTVTPQGYGHGGGTLAAGATEHHWISYLAPSGSSRLELEYTDPVQDRVLGLPLPALAASGLQRP